MITVTTILIPSKHGWSRRRISDVREELESPHTRVCN